MSNGVGIFKICRIYFCEDLCMWVGFFKGMILEFSVYEMNIVWHRFIFFSLLCFSTR